MPLFYFDTDHGDRIHRDSQGVNLSSIETMREAAMELLRDLSHEVPAIGRTIVACVVRDEASQVVYRLMMTIEGEAPNSLQNDC